MKIDVKELINLLKFANVQTKGLDKGKRVEYITDVCLKASDDFLRIEVCPNDGNIYFNIGIEAIVKEAEKFPITDLKRFIKFLSVFDGNVTLSYSNKIIFADDGITKAEYKTNETINSIVGMKYAEGKFWDNGSYMGFSPIESYNETVVTVDATVLSKTIKKVIDSLGKHTLEFGVKGEDFFIGVKNEDKGDVRTIIPAFVEGNDMSGLYSVGIDHIFNHFKGDIGIYMSEDRPMIINQEENTVVIFPEKR